MSVTHRRITMASVLLSLHCFKCFFNGDRQRFTTMDGGRMTPNMKQNKFQIISHLLIHLKYNI